LPVQGDDLTIQDGTPGAEHPADPAAKIAEPVELEVSPRTYLAALVRSVDYATEAVVLGLEQVLGVIERLPAAGKNYRIYLRESADLTQVGGCVSGARGHGNSGAAMRPGALPTRKAG
jgi:hypothetical protein